MLAGCHLKPERDRHKMKKQELIETAKTLFIVNSCKTTMLLLAL